MGTQIALSDDHIDISEESGTVNANLEAELLRLRDIASANLSKGEKMASEHRELTAKLRAAEQNITPVNSPVKRDSTPVTPPVHTPVAARRLSETTSKAAQSLKEIRLN